MKISLLLILLVLLYSYANDLQAQDINLMFQEGHVRGSIINKLAFHPDQKILASASSDKSIRVWDIETGKILKSLLSNDGHTSGVLDICFSPSGEELISVGLDNKLIVWDVSSGKIFNQTKSKGLFSSIVRITNDGKYLIIGGRLDNSSGYIELIDFNNLQTIDRKIIKNYPKDLTLISDDSFVSISNNSSIIDFWDFSDTEISHNKSFDKIRNTIASLSSSESNVIKAIDFSGNTYFIKADTIELMKKIHISSQEIEISPDSRILASLDNTKQDILIYNIDSEEIIDKYKKSFDSSSIITCFKFSPDARFIALGTDNGKIGIYNIKEKKTAQILNGVSQSVVAFTISHDEKLGVFIISSNNQNNVMIYNFEKAIIDSFFPIDLTTVNTISFMNKSNTISIVGSGPFGESIFLYDINKTSIIPFDNPCYNVYDVSFSNNNEYFAIAFNDSLKIFDFETIVPKVAIASGDMDDITLLDFHPRESEIAYSLRNGNVIVFDYETMQSDTIISHNSSKNIDLGFTSTGDSLLVINQNAELKIFAFNERKTCSIQFPSIKGPLSEAKIEKERIILAAKDHQITIFDINKINEPAYHFFHTHTELGTSPRLLQQKNLLVTCGTEGLIKFWGLDNNYFEFTFFVKDESTWAMISEDGRFDGTRNGVQYLLWTKGNSIIDLSVYFEEFFSPFLFEGRFNQKKIYEKDENVVLAGMPLPPKIKFDKDILNEKTNDSLYSFGIKTEKVNSDLNKLMVFQNKKLVETFFFDNTSRKEFYNNITISLMPGLNEIAVKAVDMKSINSNIISRRVFYEKPERKQNLYILSIGINEYSSNILNLENLFYAANDATEIADKFSNNNYLFDTVYYKLLTNEEATKENIVKSINEIATNAQKSDIFIFFFAGHGSIQKRNEMESTFCFHLFENCITSGELGEYFAGIPPLKQLLIIDACKAQNSVNDIYLNHNIKYEHAKTLARMSETSGINILTSTLNTMNAYEFHDLKHGLFTYVILDGISGKADAWQGQDYLISVQELSMYINDIIPEIAKKYDLQQIPYPISAGFDFNIIQYNPK